jgi:DNA-binding GntR family transcriptional regulator
MLVTRKRRAQREPALDAGELRELLPAAVILESLAVRQAPRFDGAAIARLRRAAARLRRAAVVDPAVAASAEDDFHRELVEPCGDARLLATVRAAQRALLPYRAAAAVGFDAIVDALERGDNAGAADRIRASFTGTLARLLAGVERPSLA